MPPYAVVSSPSTVSLVDTEESSSYCDDDRIQNAKEPQLPVELVESDVSSTDSSEQQHQTQQQQRQSPQHEVRPSKCVSFSSKVEVHPIDSREDIKRQVYTNDIWYQRSEYQAFRLECQNTVQQMAYYAAVRYPEGVGMHPSVPRSSSYFEYNPSHEYDQYYCNNSPGHGRDELCLRGLEQFVTGSASTTKLQAAHAVQAVIAEQELQRYEGVDDKDCLADIYFEKSMACQHQARQLGIRDRKEVVELEWIENRVPRLIAELAFVI